MDVCLTKTPTGLSLKFPSSGLSCFCTQLGLDVHTIHLFGKDLCGLDKSFTQSSTLNFGTQIHAVDQQQSLYSADLWVNGQPESLKTL